MSEILNAVPRAIVRGINDVSRRRVTPTPEQIPQHLPLIPHLMERGPETPQIAVGDDFNQMYGIESLNLLGRFANHQTVLANTVLGRGNMVMWKRLKPANAKTAMLRVSLEMIPAEIPLYERNNDGTYKLDNNGDRIPVLDGDDAEVKVMGHRLVWHTGVSQYASGLRPYGAGAKVSGHRLGTEPSATAGVLSTLKDGDDPVGSTLYPVFDLDLSSFGGWGDNVALRLTAPNSTDLIPPDVDTMGEIGAYLYRLAILERPDANSTAVVQETITGEQTLDLVFKEGTIHPVTGKQLYIKDRLIEDYQLLTDPSVTPIYGPFGRMHVYRTNLNEILTALADGSTEQGNILIGEGDYDTTYLPHPSLAGQYLPRADKFRFSKTDGSPWAEHRQLLNIFTGADQDGVPYYTFDVENSAAFGGVTFAGGELYASGGSDGLFYDVNGRPDKLKNLEMYDSLVAAEYSNFGSVAATGWAGLDVARYPFSTIWDSGFSLDTKKKMLIPMSRRKDINVWLSTWSVAEYSNPVVRTPSTYDYSTVPTVSEENAMAAQIRELVKAYPESEIYGTPACRVVIVGRVGHLFNGLYTDPLPFTIDMADKVSNYMGAGNGKWTAGQSFDEEPGNVVTLFRDVNVQWQTPGSYNSDWEQGIVWVQSYDRRRLFYPAHQTVYNDDTSVLNSAIVMMACCELERVAQLVWRRQTGNTRLTKDQFRERNDRLITEAVLDRFDGRFTIQPETIFTAGDDERGYSWTTNIHIYAGNMKTVGVMSIVAHRQEDLVQ